MEMNHALLQNFNISTKLYFRSEGAGTQGHIFYL